MKLKFLFITMLALTTMVACSDNNQVSSSNQSSQNNTLNQKLWNADKSPTLNFYVDMLKTASITYVMAQYSSTISPEKIECLVNSGADVIYKNDIKNRLMSKLNDEELIKADEFYQSSVGQKLIQENTQGLKLLQQKGYEQAQKTKLERLSFTQEEENIANKFAQTDIAKKLKQVLFGAEIKLDVMVMGTEQTIWHTQKQLDAQKKRCNIF